MKICVCGAPGKNGISEPHGFYLGGRRLPVIAILSCWEESTQRYFEVKDDEGRCFLLCYFCDTDHWELAGVSRAPRIRVAAVPPTAPPGKIRA